MPATEARDSFASRFNHEFRRQLHVFGQDAAAAANSGPALGRGGGDHTSGEGLGQFQLDELFTEPQQTKLDEFMRTRRIPSHLFNGDEPNGASASQRILLAGHILAEGTYVPGSFAQGVHARMCGHWVNLVLHYAGCAAGSGRGIREQFDHEGNLSMSVAEGEDGALEQGRSSEFTGARMDEEDYLPHQMRAKESRYQLRGLEQDRLDDLQAGDWLWLFNDNGGAGGNHSVVFSRFASDWEEFEYGGEGSQHAYPYRRIVCMSQISPSAGGAEETRLIGPDFMRTPNGRITPVTHYSRTSESTRPVQTAADLRAVLGTGREAERNHDHIQQHVLRGQAGEFDWEALAVWIDGQNQEKIDQLATLLGASRMTANQQAAFRDLSSQTAGANAENIGTLVRLNQRLTALITSVEAMDAGAAEQNARVESRHERMAERNGPDVTRAEGERVAAEAEIESYLAAEEAAETSKAAHDHRGELARARGQLRRDRQHRRELVQQRARARDPDEQTRLDAELETASTAMDTARAEVDRIATLQGDDRPEWRAARAAVRDARRGGQRAQRALRAANRTLDRLGASSGQYLVQSTRGAGNAQFQGRGEVRLTGEVRHLRPAPPWSDFIRPAQE